MREIFIPGAGWDTESVVSGFIKVREHNLVEQSMKIVNTFEFDEIYPFTNIFWGASPAAYGFPVIGFAGSYKQIEENWNEWLWKFSQLLSRLDAVEARVSLSCILGSYDWKLEPKSRFGNPHSRDTMQGQVWGVTECPEPDFSTDPIWLARFQMKNTVLSRGGTNQIDTAQQQANKALHLTASVALVPRFTPAAGELGR